MLYDRIVLMRELLSDQGSIFVHLDWHTGHYVKVMMDEIFGRDKFINEIVWCYFGPGSPNMKQYNRKHDTIFWYSKTGKWIFNDRDIRTSHNEKTLGNFKKGLEGSGFAADTYDLNEKGKIPEDWWEIAIAGRYPTDGVVRVGYPTEKPWPLIERILKTASNKNSIVADFFGGSGILAAVAEKNERKWISCDLGRYAVHTSRKRLLEVDKCRPFEILNIGRYERQYWQASNFGGKTREQTLAEYVAFILRLYKSEALPGSAFIHGKRGAKLVHIGSVEAPVTFSDIQNALEEVKRMKQNALVVLGWEWEMGLHDVVEQEAKKAGINLSLLSIPREVTDKRAVDAGDVQFFELAYLETETKKIKTGEYVIQLTDFVIPNLDLIPEEVKKLIKKWSDYIDYWSVDWDYKNDTFHNQWQSYRTKKDRSLELKTDPHEYPARGVYKVMIKVIDIFGNDTTRLIEIKH